MNQTNRLRLADFAGGYGETVATDAGRGLPTRVGGEASVAGVTSHENSAGGAVCSAGSFSAHCERWTEEDVASLRSVWPDAKIHNSELSGLFGRSVFAVRMKAQKLRLGERPKETAVGRPEYYARRRLEIAAMQAQREAEERQREAEERRRRWAEAAEARIAHARELLRRGIRAETVTQSWRPSVVPRVAADKDDDDAPSKPLPPSPSRRVKAEPVPRKCLRCTRAFDAPGKFVRLCDYCRTRNEGML